tara:strand:- start:314 stop:2656 length:2343 start_codon:yes stop_codon:yes gene_type:complete
MKKILIQLLFIPLFFCSSESAIEPVRNYTLSVSAQNGGTVNISGGNYEAGELVTLIATANSGYVFSGWSNGSIKNPLLISVFSNQTIEAIFEEVKYSLLINTLGEGIVSETLVSSGRNSDYTKGSIVKLTAEPSQEWVFSRWTGDYNGTENPIEINMTEEKTLTAIFEKVTYSLSIETQGEGSVSEALISDGKLTDYNSGSVVKLTALPSSGWIFSNWSGDYEGIENPVEIDITEEKNILAVFIEGDQEIQYNLSISTQGEGSVSEELIESSKITDYALGSLVRLTAYPSEGWTFSKWIGDYEGFESPVEISISESKNITAVFEQPHNKQISFNIATTFQTVDGFGAGIKRRTEKLYALDDSLREQVEAYCFQDLEVNMIRFFVYWDLEPVNDNDDPNILDETKLDWTRYDSNDNIQRSRYVGEALNNAINLSTNGFDHIIGNANSAPGWLKTNGQHNNGGTLISGGEEEYTEFLIATINGIKSRYGIDVTAISPTNEPDYQVSYESMDTTPSELSNILLSLNSRLENDGLGHIKVVSPECFRVHQSNSPRSTTTYINSMFSNPNVENAVDVVATHTYADPNHNANWNALKSASKNKPVWVTESGVNNSQDQSMSDAANYIKWIIRGFNEGGLTAYMLHLFYGEAKETGYSSLVAWTPSGEIILPKRYFALKHFANLVKPGFQRILSQVQNSNLFVVSFKSPDLSKVIVQVYNDGGLNQQISLDIPDNSNSLTHYITSDSDQQNFSISNSTSFSSTNAFINVDIPSKSMHSFVFEIDNNN